MLWVRFQQVAETLCIHLTILRGTEPVNRLTRLLLYCYALYHSKIIFSSNFVSGVLALTESDRAFTFNMNIWLALFWSTWSLVQGPDSGTCAGLAQSWWSMGSDFMASKQKCLKRLGNCFPLKLKILTKQWPCSGLFNPHPPDCFWMWLLQWLSFLYRQEICLCSSAETEAPIRQNVSICLSPCLQMACGAICSKLRCSTNYPFKSCYYCSSHKDPQHSVSLVLYQPTLVKWFTWLGIF